VAAKAHGYISGAEEPWASGTSAAAVAAYIRGERQLGETFGFTLSETFGENGHI